MGLGVVFAALLLVWEEVSVTVHGVATFNNTFWFTLFSLSALALFAYMVFKAPDNG
jgi:hypothetical protein